MASPRFRTAAVTLAVLCVTARSVRAEGRQPIRDAARVVTFAGQAAAGGSDPNANGAAIGALAGGAVMATFFVVSFNQCGKGCENDLPGWLPYFGVGLGATAGAVAGYFIDKAHHGRRKVAIAPAVSRRTKAIRIAVRF